jgi:hypothetical protein
MLGRSTSAWTSNPWASPILVERARGHPKDQRRVTVFMVEQNAQMA